MEFLQGPWPFIIVLTAFVLVFIGVNFYVCRQYTGTWHGLRYMLDPKYWAMALLNHHYSVAKEKGVPVQDFILDFSKRILLPKQKEIITKMQEKEYEYESILLPLLDDRPLYVRQIEYELGTQCALVTYRFKDNDVKWKAL